MKFKANPYYYPEKSGLTIVGYLQDPQASYSFTDVVIWQYEGKLYGASDSGCSCPTPFEDFHSLSDLTPILTIDDARRLISEAHAEYNPDERMDLLRKVRDILKEYDAPKETK